jgi:hypothetical protein
VVTDIEKIDAYNRWIAGASKGGRAEKHFTPESKERQREGARRGGSASKHFTPESKERQIRGAQMGGSKSRRNGGH